MKYFDKMILAVCLLFLLPSLAFAFNVTIENPTDKKMYYMLYWIDHNLGYGGAAHIAGGELRSHDSFTAGADYRPGTYFITWRDDRGWKNKIMFTVKDEISGVFLTPESIVFKK